MQIMENGIVLGVLLIAALAALGMALAVVYLRGRVQAELRLHQRLENENRDLRERLAQSEAALRVETERRAAAEAHAAELPALLQERTQLQQALSSLHARQSELQERLAQERQSAAEKLASFWIGGVAK